MYILDAKFGPLINGEAVKKIEAIKSSEIGFYEAIKQLDYFTNFANMIYDIPRSMLNETLYFSNDEVIAELLDQCNYHKNDLIHYLVTSFHDHNMK